MPQKVTLYFEDVAREFRTLAIGQGYDATKYPSRGVRVHAYHDRVKFRLRDNWNVLRMGIFVVDESFTLKILAYELAARIFNELQQRAYVVEPGTQPKQFREQEALLRPAP